jgi:hypothetical protein
VIIKTLIGRFRTEAAADRMRTTAKILQRTARKYAEDQPRAPAGTREGGQWVLWHKPGKDRRDTNARRRHVAMPYDGPGRIVCDEQFDSDMLQCRFAVSRYKSACRGQAMARYAACLNDDPIPPFIYYMSNGRNR